YKPASSRNCTVISDWLASNMIDVIMMQLI
ncbi:unnamed protein product, partial [marine sediment metagenome]